MCVSDSICGNKQLVDSGRLMSDVTTITMGGPESATPSLSDEEDSGEAFTDGDFDDLIGPSDGEPSEQTSSASAFDNNVKYNEMIHLAVRVTDNDDGVGEFLEHFNTSDDNSMMNGFKNGFASDSDSLNGTEPPHYARRESILVHTPSIVGILGDQQNHAEQRLAARRAARAEAREIRMRELERQQRDHENHADRAYDMYSETVSRRAVPRLSSLSPGSPAAHSSSLSSSLHSTHTPRRSSDDSDESFSVKDLRHDLKEVEEKFRAAMILTAQLDNDKAALAYQGELGKDRLLDLAEEHAQLQREHKEKCSCVERLRREHAALERELAAARDAVRARDAAAMANGYLFVEAAGCEEAEGLAGEGFGSVPPLALVSRQTEEMLNQSGEGTLDVRLKRLLSSKQELESEVRKLKLTLNEERSARVNGMTGCREQCGAEVEALRKALAEAKARAGRAEGEVALQAAGMARLEGQVARLKAQQESQDSSEEHLKQERRRLQREAREALNRVEELETENSHLTKRLDKLKNAKSALLKDL